MNVVELIYGRSHCILGVSTPICYILSTISTHSNDESQVLRERRASSAAQRSSTPPLHPPSFPSQSPASRSPHARPAKSSTTPNPRLQHRPPSPLQRHVLILLGRCLQLRRKQAAAYADRRRSRQLRGDGEAGCHARCVRCTWLVTLLLSRLQRIA